MTLKLGSRAGAGSNRVEASATGFTGSAGFTATGMPTAAGLITVDSGNNQSGALATKLAFPFVVVVTDSGFNRLGGVPVAFTVKQGGGTLNGKAALQMNTDPDGRAAAFLTLGPEPGQDNNVVEATFPGNAGSAAVFVASAKTPGSAIDTRVSGVVLDNSNNPIEGVTVRLFKTNQGNNNNTPIQAGPPVKTDAQGQFLMLSAPVGFFKLMADGTTVDPGSRRVPDARIRSRDGRRAGEHGRHAAAAAGARHGQQAVRERDQRRHSHATRRAGIFAEGRSGLGDIPRRIEERMRHGVDGELGQEPDDSGLWTTAALPGHDPAGRHDVQSSGAAHDAERRRVYSRIKLPSCIPTITIWRRSRRSGPAP